MRFAAARLAESVERKALNLVVVGSSPTVGVASIYFFVFVLVVCLLFKSIKGTKHMFYCEGLAPATPPK